MDTVDSMIAQRDQVWRMLHAGEVEERVATEWLDPLNDAAERFEINTKLRFAHWLATLIHECKRFTTFEENLNYSARGLLEHWPNRFTPQEAADYARKPEKIANRIYASRMGNGDEASGDGWANRGMGVIQLTGSDNRIAAGEALEMDFFANPELLVEPETGSLVAAWFWDWRRCNPLADKDDTTAIRKRINGGTIGVVDVAALVANLKRV